MNTLLTLIEAARTDEHDPRRWIALSAALQARGSKQDAAFCKWRARVCRQDPAVEARSRIRTALEKSTWPDRITVAEPLTLNQNLERVLVSLVDRLLTASTEDEITFLTHLTALFVGVEALRLDSTRIVARYSWGLTRAYLLDEEHEVEGTGAAYRIANLWAALLRVCPGEMSHAALQAGMQSHPTLEELGAWKRFTVMVSRAAGASMDDLINHHNHDRS